MEQLPLIDVLISHGIEISSHESDLYFPVNDVTREILNDYPTNNRNATTFTNNIDGKQWFDVPFAYLPFWHKKG
jgi:hypothetical protein